MPIHQTQVLGCLQVVTEVLDCIPVCMRRERQEATERNGVRDVQMCAHCQVEQHAHRRGVGHVCDEVALSVKLCSI